MNIVAYCRVSTNKEDQLNSLEVQKQFFNDYAEKYGYSLIRIYADEGISGTKLNKREEFKRLLRDSEKGLFEMVLTKDISRFARNALDFLREIRNLKSRGIQTRFISANLTSEDSEMVLGTLALVAQEESANTSKRIKMSKRINAEKGRVPNLVYGYDKTIGDYFNLKINPAEAEVIKRIFRMYINEGYGANKIALELNGEGLRTKRGSRWSQIAVSRILTNELYTGKIINGKQEITDFLTGVRTSRDAEDWFIYEKKELEIIDEKTFLKAAEVLAQRKNSFKNNHERQSNKHLFSTLIKCKDCGHTFRRRVRTVRNKAVPEWLCRIRNANGADACPNRTVINENELIKVIEGYFASLIKDKPAIIKKVLGEFSKLYKARDENKSFEKELRDKLSKLNREKQKYMDMYVDDIITREEMKDKTNGINKQIEKISGELKLISYNLNKGEMLENILSNTFKDIENINSIENSSNTKLRQIIEKIIVDVDGKIDIHLKLLSDSGLDDSYLIGNNCEYRCYKIESSFVVE